MRIHNVFHISLLELAPDSATTLGPMFIDKESQEPFYEINHVIGTKFVDGQRQYLIQWKGYEHSDNT